MSALSDFWTICTSGIKSRSWVAMEGQKDWAFTQQIIDCLNKLDSFLLLATYRRTWHHHPISGTRAWKDAKSSGAGRREEGRVLLGFSWASERLQGEGKAWVDAWRRHVHLQLSVGTQHPWLHDSRVFLVSCETQAALCLIMKFWLLPQSWHGEQGSVEWWELLFGGRTAQGGRKDVRSHIFLYLQIMFYYLEEVMNHKKNVIFPPPLKSQYEFNKNKITF